MSYNGIGLQTARGSGTSGRVQKNLTTSKGSSKGHYESRKQKKVLDKVKEAKIENDINKEKAKHDILQHNYKREIDLKCAELRDKLEDESEDEETILVKLDELRKKLTSKLLTTKTKENSIEKPEMDEKVNKSESATYAPRYPKLNKDKRSVR
ncbi:hypothetical protein DFJ63DRAFT_214841 [Scheffersomyces coipomensis]|uniref:uncharacterized protein n=1 Tax=Scheffersomyces coipomensis TaxID=1788519 RepID=UPI00315C60A1